MISLNNYCICKIIFWLGKMFYVNQSINVMVEVLNFLLKHYYIYLQEYIKIENNIKTKFN